MIRMLRTEERPGHSGKAPSAEAVSTPCQNFPLSSSCPARSVQACTLCPPHTWQNRDGDWVVPWAWEEWVAGNGLGPWSPRPHSSVRGAESGAVVAGPAPLLGMAGHRGRIRRLWSEQNTKELQLMLISDLEGAQRREDSLQNQSKRGQREPYSTGGHKARNAKRVRASLSVIASWDA